MSEVVSTTADVPLTGVLTRDKWRTHWLQQFCDPEDRNNPDTISSSNDLADQEFDLISQSDFLMQNLLKLDEDDKLTMQGLVSYQYPLSHIEAFLRLLLEVNEKRSSFRPEDMPVWGDECTVMDRLNVASEDFDDFVADYDNVYPIDNLGMNRSIVIMLALLYSESVVIEVLQRWALSGALGDVAALVTVVENWVPEYSVLPLDWIVNIVRG